MHNTFGTSEWNLLRITFLVHRIFWRVLNFWKICGPPQTVTLCNTYCQCRLYKQVLLSAGDPVEGKCNLILSYVSYRKHNLKSHNIKGKCSHKYYYKHIIQKNLTIKIPCIVFNSMVSPYMHQSRKKNHSKDLNFTVAQ